MNKEALHKLAAESLNEGLRLDDWDKIGCVNHDCDQCKAQQEPVAWMNPHGGMLTANYIENFASGLDKEIHNIPLYTTPQPAPVQGWKLVPVKPTKEMVDALADTDPEHDSVWDAVLAATPQAQPAQQEPVAIHQFRKCGCSDWYDGVPDHHDGQGPYEVRTLYTTPQAQPAQSTADKSELETVPAKGGLLPEQQEPVAEIVSDVNGCLSTQWSEKWTPNPGDKLYTTPQPPAQPLENYINAASIGGNDCPHVVVEKLQRAIDAVNGITKGNT